MDGKRRDGRAAFCLHFWLRHCYNDDDVDDDDDGAVADAGCLQTTQNKERKMKRPCSGCMLFMSGFLKSNDAKKYREIKQAVSEGTYEGQAPNKMWTECRVKSAMEKRTKSKSDLDHLFDVPFKNGLIPLFV